jgi:hypothetical protein
MPLVAGANPVFIDPLSPTKVRMTSENVIVSMSARESRVGGNYGFEDVGVADRGSLPPALPLTVEVPVFLPAGIGYWRGKRLANPQVLFAGRTFKPGKMSVSPLPADWGIPAGWVLARFSFRIPPELVTKRFSLQVDYTQPHINNVTAAYVPVNPPRDQGVARVSFESADGVNIRLHSKSKVKSASRTKIEVTPVHHKPILVGRAN